MWERFGERNKCCPFHIMEAKEKAKKEKTKKLLAQKFL